MDNQQPIIYERKIIIRIANYPIYYFDLNENIVLPGEVWLPITDMVVPNVQPFYAVSNYGRVFSYRTNRILAPVNVKGYRAVSMCLRNNTYRNVKIHRLVLMTFDYNPDPNLEINHKDGNKANNRLDNLEWTTPSENIIHAYDTGLHGRGENHYNAIYTEELVRLICQCLEKGINNYKAIVSICNSNGFDMQYNHLVSKFISFLKHRKTWTHVSKDYNF